MSEKEPTTLLGQRIRAARIGLGLSQEMFAGLIGTSQSAVSEIELGTTADIRVSTAIKIAEALGISVTRLLDGHSAESFDDFLLELARRNTVCERSAEKQVDWHWQRFNPSRALYYRGVAAGLKMAQSNQIAITQERRAADDRPDQDPSDAV